MEHEGAKASRQEEEGRLLLDSYRMDCQSRLVERQKTKTAGKRCRNRLREILGLPPQVFPSTLTKQRPTRPAMSEGGSFDDGRML